MDLKEFRKIPIEKRPKKNYFSPNVKLKSASSDSLTPYGKYEMELTLEGRTFTHPVVVVNKLSEKFILGMDFIEKNTLFYDMVNKAYHWNVPVEWLRGYIKVRRQVKLDALSVTRVPV